jgi:hypothetical protein
LEQYIESVFFQDIVLSATDSDLNFIVPRNGKIIKVTYYLSNSMKNTVTVNLNLVSRHAQINGLPFYSIGVTSIKGMEETFTLEFDTNINVNYKDTLQMFTHNPSLFDTNVSCSVNIAYREGEESWL